MVNNLFSALLRIISFTKVIVMKWKWICKGHQICKPIQFLNFQERSRNDNAMFLLTTVPRIQPHLITPSHWRRRDTLTDGSIRMAWEATRARWRERVVKPLVLGSAIAWRSRVSSHDIDMESFLADYVIYRLMNNLTICLSFHCEYIWSLKLRYSRVTD